MEPTKTCKKHSQFPWTCSDPAFPDDRVFPGIVKQTRLRYSTNSGHVCKIILNYFSFINSYSMERKHNSAAKLSLFVSFLFVLQFGWILAETCEKIDNCSCRKSNGKVISLREIDGPSGPAWVHLIATKLFFFHEWVSANLRKKSSHYLCRSVNKPTVLSNSILKVAQFQIGFSSSMDLCITNGQLSGSEPRG